MKSISEIKEIFNNADIKSITNLIEEFSSDERKGVQNIIASGKKNYDKYIAELERLEVISAFEKKYASQGVEYIGGIDEVGRGPLAGPVVTACVILPVGCKILGVNDSKKLSAKKRDELFDIIMEKAVSVGIGMEDNNTIDDINILQATYKAMQQAINNMPIKPQQLLVDAVTIPNIDIPQEPIIKGDAKRQNMLKLILCMILILIWAMAQKLILRQLRNMVFAQFTERVLQVILYEK